MAEPPSAPLGSRQAFIVWGPAGKGRRSIVLGRAMGVPEVSFLTGTWRRGLFRDPLKYPRQVWRTLAILLRGRPTIVYVQSPPTVATWIVAAYAAVGGGAFVIDAHSDAFQRPRWTRPVWLNRLIARRAAATLVTDEHWARRLAAWQAPFLVVPDVPVPPEMPSLASAPHESSPGFVVMVVNTWSGDEPIVEVAAAAAELPEVTFEVTGHADARVARLGLLPPNVHFAGFLPDAEYYDLMRRAQAVICLTTRDHTMQRGACEALSLGTPIITSDWPLLRSYFDRGTVHVDNTAPGIRDGVQRMMEHYDRYLDEIARLRDVRRADWDARRAELVGLLQHAAASHSRRRRKPGGQG